MNRRKIPKIGFRNMHKEFPASKGIWTEWFRVEKHWGGNIIDIMIRHYMIKLDYRENWLADMAPKEAADE